MTRPTFCDHTSLKYKATHASLPSVYIHSVKGHRSRSFSARSEGLNFDGILPGNLWRLVEAFLLLGQSNRAPSVLSGVRRIAAERKQGFVAIVLWLANDFDWSTFLKDAFLLVKEALSYLVREPNCHQPIKLGGVERSSLVGVVFVEYGSHRFLFRVLSQRQQSLLQLDLQHQAVSIAVEILLPAIECSRHQSGVRRVELVASNSPYQSYRRG